MRVPVFLADNRVTFERLYHAPAYTAQRRARYLRVPGRRDRFIVGVQPYS